MLRVTMTKGGSNPQRHLAMPDFREIASWLSVARVVWLLRQRPNTQPRGIQIQ